MTFNLKGYTTSVPSEKSISEIEKMLVEFGAEAIMKEYMGDGRIRSISFKINNLSFRLPNNSEGVYSVLYKNKALQYWKTNQKKTREEHCDRVAWRVIREWVHAQLSMIIMKQAEPQQVFLPYAIMKNQKTLYENFVSNQLSLNEYKEEPKENVIEVSP